MSNGLKDKSNYELAKIFNDRMIHNYLKVSPAFHFEYPNSEEGDCFKIAHELTNRIQYEPLFEFEKYVTSELKKAKNKKQLEIESNDLRKIITEIKGIISNDFE